MWKNAEMNKFEVIVDWILCDRKISRSIWSTIWISPDDRRWCHDPIWGDIWTETDDIGCCHDQIWSAMWIGKNVTGSFQDQFEVLFELEQMI
jgi:hypothetical protein